MNWLTKMFNVPKISTFEMMSHQVGIASPHVSAIMFHSHYDKERLIVACEYLGKWGMLGNIPDILNLARVHEDADVCHAAVNAFMEIAQRYDITAKITK